MTNQFNRRDHQQVWLRVGDLTVAWPEAQRELAEYKAKQIAAAFDPDIFGTLTVSRLPDGKYHVHDGWTRASAVRIMWGDNATVPVVVIPADSAVRAAQVFDGINGDQRTKPSAMQRFQVRVTGQFPAECAVSSVVECLGLKVSMSQHDGAIRAVGSLLTIYRQFGEDGLRDVLVFLKDAWGLDSAAFDGHLLRGASLWLAQPGLIKTDRVAKKLAKKFTPGRLLSSAKAARETFGGSLPRSVAAIIQETYAPGTLMAAQQTQQLRLKDAA